MKQRIEVAEQTGTRRSRSPRTEGRLLANSVRRRGRFVPSSLFAEFAMMLALVVSGQWLRGVDREEPPLRTTNAVPVWKTEIKLYLTAENAARAVKALRLDEHQAVKETVCFFDTSDRALERNHLILRARQKAGNPGESTVKIRASDGGVGLSVLEQTIPVEQDWTNEKAPAFSRSVDHRALTDGLFPQAVEGRTPVDSLFNEMQRNLVATRMKTFRWESLRRYGPVEAEVWNQQWKLEGFPEALTVEVWHLRKTGRSQDILEVSAKAKAETEAQAKALARQFFRAARAAGLGQPTGRTKTRKVLDFFEPGR